jgi:hypothetical protein
VSSSTDAYPQLRGDGTNGGGKGGGEGGTAGGRARRWLNLRNLTILGVLATIAVLVVLAMQYRASAQGRRTPDDRRAAATSDVIASDATSALPGRAGYWSDR